VRKYILSSTGGSYIYLIIFCFMKKARREINLSFSFYGTHNLEDAVYFRVFYCAFYFSLSLSDEKKACFIFLATV
jgi:hypothetical protein